MAANRLSRLAPRPRQPSPEFSPRPNPPSLIEHDRDKHVEVLAVQIPNDAQSC